MRTKDEGSSEKQLCSIRIKSKAHPENLIYFLYKIKTFLKNVIIHNACAFKDYALFVQ